MSEAITALARVLRNPDSGIQRSAAIALARIGGVEALKELLASLPSLETTALSATVDSLSSIGDSAAVLPLIWQFHLRPTPAARGPIIAALRRLGGADSDDQVASLLSEQAAAQGPVPPLPEVTAPEPRDLP
jgi:hypothetical protein